MDAKDKVVNIFCTEWTMDDYAKDGGPREVWFLCSFYYESLRSLIVKEVQ